MYTYCANNPVRYTDPSGHIITEIVLGAVIVGGLLALTSCDSKTVGKAPVQTSTSNPDYAGTTTQVATSSRATSQTTRTTTTTTSVANSKKYTRACSHKNSIKNHSKHDNRKKNNIEFIVTSADFSKTL